MTDPFQEARRKAREEYRRETAHEATDAERERDALAGVPPNTRRDDLREKIARLAAESPYEGERASARARLAAFDNPSASAHAATERGSYYARDTLAGSGNE